MTTITTGVGGTNLPTYDNTTVQQTSGTQSSNSTTPEMSGNAPYLGLPFLRSTLDSLGLTLPRNLSDAGVLLAQVALALDEIFAQNNSEALKADTATRRSAFAATLALQQSITTLSVRNEELATTIQTWETEKTTKINERAGKIEQKSIKETEASQHANNAQYYLGQYSHYYGLAANEKNPQLRAQYESLRDYNLQNYYLSSNASWNATQEANALGGQISQLTSAIDLLQTQIDTAKTEIETNEANIETYTTQIAELLSLIALLSAGGSNAPGTAQDSGLSVPIEELADALKDFDLRFGTQNLSQTFSQLRDTDLDAIQRVAGKALAVISAIIDVLQALLGLEPPPSLDTAATTNGRMRLSA